MLNSVSFRSNAGVFDKPDFTRPQAFTRPATQQPVLEDAPKKKGKTGKVVAGLVVTAAVVAGLLAAGNKYNVLKNVGKHIPEGIKNASWLQWAKEPAKKAVGAMDQAGAWLVGKGGAAVDYVKNLNIVDKVKGLFGKGTPSA